MFGVGIGDLVVYLQPVGSNVQVKVWSETGNQGNQWKRARIDLRNESPFQVSDRI